MAYLPGFIDVTCLDTHETLTFQAKTPLIAMQKLLYYLNLSKRDDSAKINKTESGYHLYTIHNGRYWAVRNHK